jgi:hypothetical protein
LFKFFKPSNYNRYLLSQILPSKEKRQILNRSLIVKKRKI